METNTKTIEGFKIYNNTTTSFSFIERIRILFGKKFHADSIIIVDKEVNIIKSTETKSYVDNIFPKKSVGYECKSDSNYNL